MSTATTAKPMGDLPLPKDPPKTTDDSAEPMGDIPLPKDPPTATSQIMVTAISDVPSESSQDDLEVKAA